MKKEEEFVVAYHRAEVLGGLEAYSRPLPFGEAIARADELDPVHRLGLTVLSVDEYQREKRKRMAKAISERVD